MSTALKAIKAKHEELGAMIAALETQEAYFEYQGKRINLNRGEIYVATITTPGEYGSYHLILLPGEAESINWAKSMEWASEQGGELPNRVEGAILFATCKQEFQEAAYWTREPSVSNDGWAWFQGFTGGLQDGGRELSERRARAVRRLIIE